jgi:ubiquinone/menaquinone biosynthesis C-methylase UbiE
MKPINGLKKDLLSYRLNKEMNRTFDILNDKRWSPFMNHGYKNLDGSNVIQYNKEDEKWSNRINLYTHLVEVLKKYELKFKELDVLDIGCGFGHGTSLLKKYYNFKNVTGLDFNGNFINDAKSKFNNVEYVHASATSLPFKNNSVDIITNIESLHHYKGTHYFYREAYRVLKPGGYVLTTDVNTPYETDLIAENLFERSGFYMTDKINITPMVTKSCEEELNTFEIKHEGIGKEKIEYFKEILEEKYKLYSTNANVFLSYVYYKI